MPERARSAHLHAASRTTCALDPDVAADELGSRSLRALLDQSRFVGETLFERPARDACEAECFPHVSALPSAYELALGRGEREGVGGSSLERLRELLGLGVLVRKQVRRERCMSRVFSTTVQLRYCWLVLQLGASEAEVTGMLTALAEAGQIRKKQGRWIPQRVLDVDTGREPQRARALKAAWSQLALDRLRAGSPGLFGYSVFAISRQDLVRLRELQLEYVRAMQSVIAGSQPDECVALFCMQLLDLSAGPDNALA